MTKLLSLANFFQKRTQLLIQASTPKDYYIRQWNFSRPEGLQQDIFQLTGDDILSSKCSKLQEELESWQDQSYYNLFVADLISYSEFGPSDLLAQKALEILHKIKQHSKLVNDSEALKSKFPHVFGFLQFLIFYCKIHQKWKTNQAIKISEWSILLSIQSVDDIRKKLLEKINFFLDGGIERLQKMQIAINDLLMNFPIHFKDIKDNFSVSFCQEQISKKELLIENYKNIINKTLQENNLENFQNKINQLIDAQNHVIMTNVIKQKLKETMQIDCDYIGVNDDFLLDTLAIDIKAIFSSKKGIKNLQLRMEAGKEKLEELEEKYQILLPRWLAQSKNKLEFVKKLNDFFGLQNDYHLIEFEFLVESYFEAKNQKSSQNPVSEQEQDYFNAQKLRLTSHHDGLFLPELIARLEIN